MTQEQSTPMKSLILTFLSEVFHASPLVLQGQERLSMIHGELSSLSFPEYLQRNTLHISCLRMYPRSARFAKAGFLPRSSVSYLDWGICANGNVLTARLTFPKARKRVFLVGYLDPRCAGEILPIERKGGKALSELTDHQPQGKRVYDATGTAITQSVSCGGFGGRTGLYLVDYNENSKFTDTARCITARQDSGMSHRKGEHSAVFFEYDGVYPVINPDRVNNQAERTALSPKRGSVLLPYRGGSPRYISPRMDSEVASAGMFPAYGIFRRTVL